MEYTLLKSTSSKSLPILPPTPLIILPLTVCGLIFFDLKADLSACKVIFPVHRHHHSNLIENLENFTHWHLLVKLVVFIVIVIIIVVIVVIIVIFVVIIITSSIAILFLLFVLFFEHRLWFIISAFVYCIWINHKLIVV